MCFLIETMMKGEWTKTNSESSFEYSTQVAYVVYETLCVKSRS